MIPQTKLQIIHFTVENVHLCIDLQFINKIIILPMLKSVPGCPNYLAGLLNMASKSIPVIDLAIRLGLHRRKKYSLETPILICSYSDRETGLIVDSIGGLKLIAEGILQMRDEFNDPHLPFHGVLPIDGQLALLIDMKRILTTNSKIAIPKIN